MEAKNKKGETALCLAVDNGQKSAVDVLLQNKANVHYLIPVEGNSTKGSEEKNKDGKEEMGTRPIHLAAARGRDEIIGLLVEAGADINVRDKDGKTPLMLSVQRLQCMISFRGCI